MAIKGNVSDGVKDLGATGVDVSVLVAGTSSLTRAAVTAFSLFNTTAGAITVEVYESPDATSASGILVASHSVDADASQDVSECIGQGYSSGQQLVCKITTAAVSTGDVNAKVTYSSYTAGS